MEGFGALILLGSLLVVLGLSLGSVIGWFKFRRYGAEVDYGALGIGFLIAGAVALLILVPTDGPWIIGIAFLGVEAVYLVRSRRTPRVGTMRMDLADRTESGDTSASTNATEPSDRDVSTSRIQIGDRVLLTTDMELPRRDRDWRLETLAQGTVGGVLRSLEK